MVDREKVIKALEFCTNQRIVDTCYGECPYAVADDEYKCVEMKLDALALLKEQEAVEPYQHDAIWLCGNCEQEVVGWDDPITIEEIKYPFCRKCGKKVKWE